MLTIYPDTARNSLRSLEIATEPERAAPTTEMLRSFVSLNDSILRFVAELWTKELARLDEPAPGHLFLRSVEAFLDCLLTAKRVIRRIDDRAAEKGDEALDVRSDAYDVTVEIDRLIGELSGYQKWLASASSPEAKAALLEAAEKVASDPNTKYTSGDEILAHLQAGGDL